MGSDNLDRFNSFKSYFSESINTGQTSLEIAEKERYEFISEYPLERINVSVRVKGPSIVRTIGP